MTTTYVALLRGVNVGGRTTVRMAALKDVFVDLGYSDVSTYIQSGNVVFTSAKAVRPSGLEGAIEKAFKREVTVMLRTAEEMRRVVQGNPFADADVSKVHVGFMVNAPVASVVRGLDTDRFDPEAVAVKGADVYMHLPNGIGRSKLPDYVVRQLKAPMTVRNWNTVTKLAELSA